MMSGGILGVAPLPPGRAGGAEMGFDTDNTAIRINDQFRLCFVWTVDGPAAVEVVDYH